MRVCWQQREKKNADAADVLFSIFFSLGIFLKPNTEDEG